MPLLTPEQVLAELKGNPSKYYKNPTAITELLIGSDDYGVDGKLISFDKKTNTLVVDVKIGDDLHELRTYSGTDETSLTSKGELTPTRQLLDADDNVLLTAGPKQTLSLDPSTGVFSVRATGKDDVTQYDPASGNYTHVVRDSKGQTIDSDVTTKGGALVGDAFVSGGATFTRTPNEKGGTDWLDPNGKTQGERSKQGSTDSDEHIMRRGIPEDKKTAALDSDSGDLQHVHGDSTDKVLVAYTPANSEGYTEGPNGILARRVDGQSDLVEGRYNDGSGRIYDTKHDDTIVAVLQPGDLTNHMIS